MLDSTFADRVKLKEYIIHVDGGKLSGNDHNSEVQAEDEEDIFMCDIFLWRLKN